VRLVLFRWRSASVLSEVVVPGHVAVLVADRAVRVQVCSGDFVHLDLITDFLSIANQGPGVPPPPLTAAESGWNSKKKGVRSRVRHSVAEQQRPFGIYQTKFRGDPAFLEACQIVTAQANRVARRIIGPKYSGFGWRPHAWVCGAKTKPKINGAQIRFFCRAHYSPLPPITPIMCPLCPLCAHYAHYGPLCPLMGLSTAFPWRLTLPRVPPAGCWGGLVGDRGHRKGQLRVLGSPSARRTKGPRTGGPPGGARSPRTDFFLRKSLRTYLRVLKPDCRPPGPIGNILAKNQELGIFGGLGLGSGASPLLAAGSWLLGSQKLPPACGPLPKAPSSLAVADGR
jgi:hypothetical protein